MSDDASLDEFIDEGATGSGDGRTDDGQADDVGVEDAGESAASTDAETDADSPEGPDDTDESVPPATTTYAWSDEGTACEACGAVVEQRWEQDGSLVCPDCKEW